MSCGAKPVQGRQAVDSQAPVDVALPFLSESRLHVRRRCGEVEKTDGCRWFSVGRGVSPFASCFRRCRKLLKKERRTRERKWSATHSPISRPSRAGNSSNGSAVRPGCLARCMRFRWGTDPQIVSIPPLTVNLSLVGLSRWALFSAWFSRQGLQAHVPLPHVCQKQTPRRGASMHGPQALPLKRCACVRFAWTECRRLDSSSKEAASPASSFHLVNFAVALMVAFSANQRLA